MTSFVGKLFIVAGLGFQAYDLIISEDTSNKFNSNFEKALRKGTQYGVDLNSVLSHKAEHIKLLVAALYALSVLLLVSRSKFLKFLIIIGVILNSLIMTNPIVDRTEGIILLLFQNIAIIGGLFYMMGEGAPVVKQVPAASPTSTQNSSKKPEALSNKKRA